MITWLQIENLTKSFGDQVLFSDISFSVLKDQKVALIAPNGAGKSTLLNIIARKETPDSGKVIFRNDLSVGYLSQHPEFDYEKTVIQYVFDSANELMNIISAYENAIISGNQLAIENETNRMDAANAWDIEVRIKQILSELKIEKLDQKVGELSGGQQKRLALANVLINEPDLLILDEPTNHLDIEMIDWLEEYLYKTKSTLLMVTHDRYFLDRVCNEIIEIDNNNVFSYKGNYSYYLEKRQERINSLSTTVERANNLLRTELEWMRKMPRARGTKAKYRIDNFYKLQEVANQKIGNKSLELNIKTRRLGKKVFDIYDLSKSFSDFCAIKNFSYKFAQGEKIGIVGKNGTGKSTFLNILTGCLQPDSGFIETGETVVTGYYRQEGISFDENKRVIEVVKEISEIITLGNGNKISATQFLEYFLFPSSMHYAPVAKLSGGERRRLYLMTVLMTNPNVLVLDEPTNDLDIMTLNVLEEYLTGFQGCVLIVSHDRYFMDKVVDNLLVFEGNGVLSNFVGNYTEYWNEYKVNERITKENEKKEKTVKEKPKQEPKKFGFKEQREFDSIEKELVDLIAEKDKLTELISSGTIAANEMIIKSNRISELINIIDEKETRWLELSELRENK